MLEVKKNYPKRVTDGSYVLLYYYCSADLLVTKPKRKSPFLTKLRLKSTSVMIPLYHMSKVKQFAMNKTSDNDYDIWTKLDISDELKQMFASPLPPLNIPKYPLKSSISSSEVISEKPPTSSKKLPTRRVYKVNGVDIKIDKLHYESCYKFTVQFTTQNEMTKEKFFDTYIKRCSVNVVETEEDKAKIRNSLKPQKHFKQFKFKSEVEKVLDEKLYEPLKSMISINLMETSFYHTASAGGFLLIRGCVEDRFEPLFSSSKGDGTRFMGFNGNPSLSIGYTRKAKNDNKGHFVCLTGLGEVELPSIDIERILYDLPVNSGSAQPQINNSSDRLKQTVQQLITTAVHTGVNKVILTNYVSFILIRINPNFIILNQKQDKSLESVSVLDSEYIIFLASEDYIRLCIFFFFFNSRKEIESMEKFKERVLNKLKEETERLLGRLLMKNLATSSRSTGSTTQSVASMARKQNYLFPGGQFPLDYSTMSSWSAGYLNGLYERLLVDPQLFRSQFLVELGVATQRYLRVGEYLPSQIILVFSFLLLPRINRANKFSYSDSIVEPMAVLKIFDPYWQKTIYNEAGELKQASYQHSLDTIVNELKCYSLLSKEMGKLVPFVISYGNIADVQVSVGKGYCRFEGPYLLLQSFESVRDYTVKQSNIDRDFVEKHIIPKFQILHSYKVLHNNFKFDNIIITNSKEVKIIDFSKSIIPCEDPKMFELEINNIYSYFGLL